MTRPAPLPTPDASVAAHSRYNPEQTNRSRDRPQLAPTREITTRGASTGWKSASGLIEKVNLAALPGLNVDCPIFSQHLVGEDNMKLLYFQL